jgi:hypothetical protein
VGKFVPYVPHIIETDHFTDNNGNKYAIQGNINGKTVGVIYAIICTECKSLVYVGQTGDTLYQRMILNTEKRRSCWKIFFTKKSYEEKLKIHRNKKGTRHGKLQESKNIYLDEKTEHFRIRRTQYTI